MVAVASFQVPGCARMHGWHPGLGPDNNLQQLFESWYVLKYLDPVYHCLMHCMVAYINGNSRILKWRYLPYILYVRWFAPNIWPYIGQYFHFRTLELPLITWFKSLGCWLKAGAYRVGKPNPETSFGSTAQYHGCTSEAFGQWQSLIAIFVFINIKIYIYKFTRCIFIPHAMQKHMIFNFSYVGKCW